MDSYTRQLIELQQLLVDIRSDRPITFLEALGIAALIEASDGDDIIN